jgi:hypothetical protein
MRQNIKLIDEAAVLLKDILDDLVFVGGATTGLYADNIFAPELNQTFDVDCIIEVASRKEYVEFESKIRLMGFKNDISKGAPICRYQYGTMKIDFMPTKPEIIGFSNIWYEEGFKETIEVLLPVGVKIKLFKPEYFLASKIEAFKNRGNNDLRTSQDFEDIVFVVENRKSLINELRASKDNVRNYLKLELSAIIKRRDLTEGIYCVISSGNEEERISHLKSNFNSICTSI